jgi:hypothetical protein
MPITAVWNENVYGLTLNGITVAGGTKESFTGSDGSTTFTFTITPTVYTVDQFPRHTVSAVIPAGGVTDYAGNINPAAVTISRVYDPHQPTITIVSGAGLFHGADRYVKDSPIPITVTFAEDVDGVTISDLVLTGSATVTSLASTNGASGAGFEDVYTFQITPSAEGTITAHFPASRATDSASNVNTVSATLAFIFDTTVPTVALTKSLPYETNVSPLDVTATFSEVVTDFVIADVTTSNGNAQTLVSSTAALYSFVIVPSAMPAIVTGQVLAGVCIDYAGNLNTVSNVVSWYFDTTQPTPIITSSAGTITATKPVPFTITFDKEISGFTNAKMSVVGGALSALTETTTGLVFTGTVAPYGHHVSIIARVPAGVVQDANGNVNAESAVKSIIFDNISPLVTALTTDVAITNVAPLDVTVTFNENILDSTFLYTDLKATGGTALDSLTKVLKP